MVAVIGDVHGCFHTLKALVEKIRKKYSGISIYCVGDLVDRGNNSFKVLEFMMAENIQFTLGNHDFMFYSNMRDPFSLMAKSWNYNGAETTLASYKEKINLIDEHLDYIIGAPLFFNIQDCFISHAGISVKYKSYFENSFPSDDELSILFKKDLDDQNSIIWARGNLLNIRKLQVVGHTHRKEVFFDKDANTVYIDTTAYGNNKLTSIIVNQNKLIDTLEEKTMIDDVNRNWTYNL